MKLDVVLGKLLLGSWSWFAMRKPYQGENFCRPILGLGLIFKVPRTLPCEASHSNVPLTMLIAHHRGVHLILIIMAQATTLSYLCPSGSSMNVEKHVYAKKYLVRWGVVVLLLHWTIPTCVASD